MQWHHIVCGVVPVTIKHMVMCPMKLRFLITADTWFHVAVRSGQLWLPECVRRACPHNISPLRFFFFFFRNREIEKYSSFKIIAPFILYMCVCVWMSSLYSESCSTLTGMWAEFLVWGCPQRQWFLLSLQIFRLTSTFGKIHGEFVFFKSDVSINPTKRGDRDCESCRWLE